MTHIYDHILKKMELTVHNLAARISEPQQVPYKNSFVFRYAEKTIYQAIVQKLARCVSGLHAVRLLMCHGFAQEQASIQRMLDELQEDVKFLSYGVILGDVTELHKRYLDDFYQEEFDADTSLASTQKRDMTPRKKIHAYLSKMGGKNSDPSTHQEVSRTISKAYSGFIHGASPHIMDMYGGNPAKFHMNGMLDAEIHQDHEEDIWNYFYRGIMAFAFAAKAFGDEKLFADIYEFQKDFAVKSGRDYFSAEKNQKSSL